MKLKTECVRWVCFLSAGRDRGMFMVLFFLLTAFAAIGAMISLVEVVVSFLVNRVNMPRNKATWITVAGMALMGSLAALSNSAMANVKVFGMNFFDLYDYASSNVLLPLGGFFLAIFITWVWGFPKFEAAVTNDGRLMNRSLIKVIFQILKYLTPILVAIILLTGLNVISL